MPELRFLPSNWLYNLSVYGFLRVLKEHCNVGVEEFLMDDGSVKIPTEKLSELSEDQVIKGILELSIIKKNLLGGQKAYFSNSIQQGEPARTFKSRIKNLLGGESPGGRRSKKFNCILCFSPASKSEKLKSTYGKIFPVKREDFPNNYWAYKENTFLCSICSGLTYFHVCGFIQISGDKSPTGVFVNTPSFKHIWMLNQHLEKIHAKERIQDIKTLFGLSLIDLSVDLNIKLGLWQKYSTEIVVFKEDYDKLRNEREYVLDFYEIAPHILQILENKNIASILRNIGSIELLKQILNGNFKVIEILSYLLLRIEKREDLKNRESLLEKYFGTTNINFYEKAELLSKLRALIAAQLNEYKGVFT